MGHQRLIWVLKVKYPTLKFDGLIKHHPFEIYVEDQTLLKSNQRHNQRTFCEMVIFEDLNYTQNIITTSIKFSPKDVIFQTSPQFMENLSEQKALKKMQIITPYLLRPQKDFQYKMSARQEISQKCVKFFVLSIIAVLKKSKFIFSIQLSDQPYSVISRSKLFFKIYFPKWIFPKSSQQKCKCSSSK